ncbi:MAG: S-ribosylhomocysteine lyase [Eggerthellaceae bacterium]|nr:S-ribosylhomocysteine lyase [Eggerthellaceae bacterium]
MQLEKISSFQVDHTTLLPGIYLSRIDGDAYTYDIRMKQPNKGDYLSTGQAHTLEHLFATYARSSAWRSEIIYVGPMGCRTGFYLITKDISRNDVIKLTQESFLFMANFDGAIPGATERECGNYLDQDLAGAKKQAQAFYEVISSWTPEQMEYARRS